MKPLGAIARASARHRVSVLSVSALLLLLLGAGMQQLTFSDNPTDAMPRGDPNTEASYELLERFPGSAYAAALYVSVDPEKWAKVNDQLQFRAPFEDDALRTGQDDALGSLEPILRQGTQGNAHGPASGYPGPQNITDEVYMRAQEELFLFLQERLPEMRWGITLPSQIKLVNYTNSGVPNPVPGQDALVPLNASTFSMPGAGPQGAEQFNTAWQTYWAASLDSIKTIVSADWKTARMGLLFAPGDQRLDEIGSKFYKAVEAYQDEVRRCDEGGACSLEYNAFDPDDVIVDPRGPSAAAAYLTETTLDDLIWLAPIAGIVIIGCILLAFRTPGTVIALMLPMGLAGIGVLGIFGFIGLPIHSVSLLVFPVLMGNGIDFAIHMANAYHNARGKGAGVLDSAQAAGEHAGVPLAIATLTTVAGMALLIAAPNRLLTQLGLAIVLGMALLLVVSLTVLPAALSFARTRPASRDLVGRAMHRNAVFWNRNKALGILLIGGLALGGVAASGALDTLVIGTPAAFFPEGDRQREDFDRSNEMYFKGNEDLVTNALVVQGDIVAPETMAFLQRLEQELKDVPFVRNESAVSLAFAVNAWIQVREGTAGAPLVIAQESGQPGSTFPDDRESIKALVDEMFDTPLATYASFFVNQPQDNGGEYDISVVLMEVYQDRDLDGLEDQWNGLQAAIQRADPPEGIEVTISGQSAVAYLFTAKEMPYVKVASFIGLAATGLLVLAIRRSVRDALTVAAVVGSAGLMWLGALYLLDIPLSIALVVPVVIIAAIGSDYALHLRHGLARDGPAAWALVGRAVLYSAITDLIAFLVFTRMRYGLLADATMATVAALAASLLATLVLVPLFARRAEVETTLVPQTSTPRPGPAAKDARIITATRPRTEDRT